MESTWCAVDKNNYIAVFDTDEGGAMFATNDGPVHEREVDQRFTCDFEVELVAAALWLRFGRDPALEPMLPSDREEATALLEVVVSGLSIEDDLTPWLALWGAAGLFRYRCPSTQQKRHAQPYIRESTVPCPLELDALPDELRQRLESTRIATDFASAPLFAPGEIAPVAYWGDCWYDTAGNCHIASKDGPTHEVLDLDMTSSFSNDEEVAGLAPGYAVKLLKERLLGHRFGMF